MKKTLNIILLLILFCSSAAYGQVNWSFNLIGDKTASPALEITATIGHGYHLYAIDNPDGGMPLQFFFDFKGCKPSGSVTADKKYTVAYNDVFESNEHYYTGTVKFTQKLTPTAESFSVAVEAKGQVCDDHGCFQVGDSHKFIGTAILEKSDTDDKTRNDSGTEEESAENKSEQLVTLTDSLQTAEPFMTPEPNMSDIKADDWWANVEAEMKMFEEAPEQQTRSLWYIFITGFIGGLIALVTPCVWPLIPMTVSFFLKQNKSRSKAIGAATTYGISIIVIYVLLGLLVTIIFGASALNELATSAGFNIAFFILLVVFAVSFMGGFELTLPASWSNKIDSKVDSTTGYLSIFFMAFTLALVSFSCTGPIIGTLLVEAAATSNFVSPAIGMFGFALALALPFSLFAMFPTMLKSMPKSGGWMNTVKVVLGFLELALALKFLSVADLAYGWRILDREVFISLWIVIFALLGVYLLGKITFPHDSKTERIGVTRFMLACVSLAFAVYMLPGLWGAPLKSISAFAPPVSTQDFNLYEGSVHAQVDDFDEGMRLAGKLDKPVLLDFSGYGCVNCRKMEAAVWTDPAVKSKIDNDYILVTLMVDDKNPLPEPIVVKEKDGKERTLRTYGDKWSYLQRTKFGANAQPYHVIVDKQAKPLAPAFVYKEDIPGYVKFLDNGKKRFTKIHLNEKISDIVSCNDLRRSFRNAQTYIQYVDSADNYIKRENWEAAERMTIAALRLKPANKLNYLLWSNLGDIRTRQQNYEGALEAFEIALASAPRKELILNNRAYTYLQMGEAEKALADIDCSLSLDSVQEWPLRIRGSLNLGKGRYNDADRDFSSLQRHFPTNAAAYSGLGKLAALRGDADTAAKLLKQSLDLEQDEDTWFYLVLVNIESDKIPKAKELLLTALKRYPRSGNLYLARGIIHKRNFENDAAEIDKKIAIDYGADPHLVEQYFPKLKK